MICPHCLKTIEDGASFCPYCNAYVGPGDGPEHTEFVFCEGCGARLSPHDRTCPKCGRPAPGILSEDAAASDLAAGRTAGFPRLTQEQIDTEVPHAPASAAAVLSDAADPNETCVLPAFDKDFGIPKVDIPTPVSLHDDAQKPKRKVHPDEDAYHKHKRHIPKPLIVIAVLAVVCGGAYWFVTADPMGVMPAFYDQFGQAAQTTFPTRQKGEATEDDTKQDDSAEDVKVMVLSAGQRISGPDHSAVRPLWYLAQVVVVLVFVGDEDQIGEVIDSFNNGYLRTPLSTRQELSQSAYALRDQIKKTQDELNNLKYQDDTVYADDIAHLKQLAEWMYERVDVICQSWDISLAIPDGESMSSHQSEILAPIAQGGNSALNQYDANVGSWKPQQRSQN